MSGWLNRGVFRRLFSKKQPSEGEERATDIGMPTDVKHNLHVSKNSETGMLEGLPFFWSSLLYIQIPPAEQNENPDAAIPAVKFHMNSIMKEKTPDEPFKPFLTDEAITEENKEIEKLRHQKNV